MELFPLKNEYYLDGNNINTSRELSSINTTQSILSNDRLSKEGKESLKELVTQLRNSKVKAYLENGNFEDEFDNAIIEWNEGSQKKNGESYMCCDIYQLKPSEEFIKQVMEYDDFKSGIIIENSSNSVWIVIEDACFKENRKYIRSAREFNNNNNCNIELTIFDIQQMDSMYDQLKSYKNQYKVFKKNGK